VIARLRRPQTTVRWRLTLLYGGLFLVCGAALLAVTYTLVSNATLNGPTAITRAVNGPPNPGPATRLPSGGFGLGLAGARKNFLTTASARAQVQRLLKTRKGQQAVQFVVASQRGADLNALEVKSGIALGVMAIISALLGWVVAGRVLRPLRTMTVTAQEISEENLHRRLAMPGPRDELRQLADTIDGLLARLEGAFDAQRRFVANASHELRTPLTAARALLEMVLTDPHASVRTFRETCTQVLKENEYQEQLIDALLTLAQGQRGLDRHEVFDLAETAAGVVSAQELAAAAHGLRIGTKLEPVLIDGDPRLVERLVTNLVENAIRHNVWDGRVGVRVEAEGDAAVLAVAHTGPVVPQSDVARLTQPFQRLSGDRVDHGGGLGLGLSIVAAVAVAHHAELDIEPRDGGGLRVEVRFSAARGRSLAPGAELVLDDLSQRVARERVDELHPAGALERSEPVGGECQ
jgi:signal transduction histidine kinase